MIMIMIIYNKYYQYRYISNYCNTPRPQPVGPTELVPPHGQYPATVLALPSQQREIVQFGPAERALGVAARALGE